MKDDVTASTAYTYMRIRLRRSFATQEQATVTLGTPAFLWQ